MPNHIMIDDAVILDDIIKVLDSYSVFPEFYPLVLSCALSLLLSKESESN